MWKTMDEATLKSKKVVELKEIAKTFGLKGYPVALCAHVLDYGECALVNAGVVRVCAAVDRPCHALKYVDRQGSGT